MALDGLHQRGLFSADVAAGADEDFELEAQAGAEDVLPAQAERIDAGQFGAEDFDLLLVFVAAVEIALLSADDETADDHSLEDEVGEMLQNEAVFDGSRLALVGVADDEFLCSRGAAGALPLAVGGKAGAAHAAEFAVFQCIEHPVMVAGLDELPQSAIAAGFVGIGVGLEMEPALGEAARQVGLALGDVGAEFLKNQAGGRGQVGLLMDVLVDAHHQGMIAAADAGDIADEHVGLAGEAQLQRLAELSGAMQVAGHIVADANVGAGQRFQPEMRKETGDGMNVFNVEAAAAGDDLKLRWRNEALLLLGIAQVLDNVPGLPSRNVAAVGDL